MGRILLLSMMMSVWSFQAQDAGDNCPLVEETSQSFCESEGSGNNYYRPAVKHLQATPNGEEVVWFDTAESDAPLNPEELLIDGEVYFAGTASGNCTNRTAVSVTLFDSPNAGGTTFYEVAINAEPFDLLDVYNPSILGPPEAGGTVEPPLNSGTTIFDPSVDGSGQYRYTVTSNNEICKDDSSYIYITVVPDPQEPSEDPEENCAYVEEEVQIFCESQGEGNNFYRPAVAHLVAYANGDDIVWYDTQTSNEPLSMDEILVDGEDYYAAAASGTCDARVRVQVVVNTSPNAGATTFVTFCSEAGPVDLLDYFNSSIIGEPDAGGVISPALASGTTIFDPSQDSPGQYVYSVPANETCKGDIAVMYVSIAEGIRLGDDITLNLTRSNTPIDLFAELGIPADASANVSPVLTSGTGEFDPSVDAAGVYTVTVDNEEGCEDDSAQVTINIQGQGDEEANCPVVEFSTQEFCASQGTGNDFYRPSVAHLSANITGDSVIWYATEDAGEPLSPDEILVDGEDYFAGDASRTCMERPRVVVSIMDTPNAGGTTFVTVNSNDEPFDLLEVYNPSILGAPDAGGTFNPPLASGTTIFDPSVDQAGQYKYTVESTTDCPDDSSYIYITIEEAESEAVASDVNQVTMFPNPSKGNINISLGEGVTPVSVRIFDLSGNTVKRLSLDSESQLQNLDISGLSPSIYFAEVQTNKGTVVKRIIKN